MAGYHLLSYALYSPMKSLIRGGGVLMRLGVATAVACLSMVGLAVADDVFATNRQATHIPAQSLSAALQTLAKERGWPMLWSSRKVRPSACARRHKIQEDVSKPITTRAVMISASGTPLWNAAFRR